VFTSFFLELRAAEARTSPREYLTLIEALREGVVAFASPPEHDKTTALHSLC
jgi:uncharacterized protein with von Willebrand factor type A (vWA) domain